MQCSLIDQLDYEFFAFDIANQIAKFLSEINALART